MHTVILGWIGHQVSICTADEIQTQVNLITQLVVELVFKPMLSDFFFIRSHPGFSKFQGVL